MRHRYVYLLSFLSWVGGFALLYIMSAPPTLVDGGTNDSKMDGGDAIFSSLRMWQDQNHNGTSEANELSTLPAVEIASLDLDYKESKRTDEHGNQFKYRAKVRDARGARVSRWAWDVIFRLEVITD